MNHILVVDDEPLMRTWLSKSIPKHSTCFDVPNTAQDGIEAIDYLKQAAYDVVITDIKMPGMDGLNLAKFIQENYPDTVVIIISGFNDFAYARKAIQYGVKDYLLKPLVDDDLIKLLNDISKRLQKHTPTLLANPTEEERSNPRAMLFRAILEDDSDGIYQVIKSFPARTPILCFRMLVSYKRHCCLLPATMPFFLRRHTLAIIVRTSRLFLCVKNTTGHLSSGIMVTLILWQKARPKQLLLQISMNFRVTFRHRSALRRMQIYLPDA